MEGRLKEDKFAKWIRTHTVSWCFVLLFLGIMIGLILLNNPKQGFIYGLFFIFAELFAGGSGSDLEQI